MQNTIEMEVQGILSAITMRNESSQNIVEKLMVLYEILTGENAFHSNREYYLI
jgi:hypothetical protein